MHHRLHRVEVVRTLLLLLALAACSKDGGGGSDGDSPRREKAKAMLNSMEARGGLMRISVNGNEVARGRIERTFLIPAGLGETFDIGDDTGATVIDYPNGHSFNGEIRKIEVFLK